MSTRLRARSTDGNKEECNEVEDEIIDQEEGTPSLPLAPSTYSFDSYFKAREFKPLVNMSVWKDPRTKDSRISLAVLLESGVGESPGDLKVCVDGQYLRITVKWPSVLMDVLKLNAVFLQGDGVDRIEDYHPQIVGFYDFLEQFQRKEGDAVESVAKIPLPFFVKPDFHKRLMAWEGTSEKVLYVTLFAPDRHFVLEEDVLAIKTVRYARKGDHTSVSTVSM